MAKESIVFYVFSLPLVSTQFRFSPENMETNIEVTQFLENWGTGGRGFESRRSDQQRSPPPGNRSAGFIVSGFAYGVASFPIDFQVEVSLGRPLAEGVGAGLGARWKAEAAALTRKAVPLRERYGSLRAHQGLSPSFARFG